MTNSFEWNGVQSANYGVYVLTQPSIIKPGERATFTSVPGRNGALTTLEGDDVYDDLILTTECFIKNANNIGNICGWLRGSGIARFPVRAGGHYNARVVNQIAFDKVLSIHPHRTFAVNFRCHPFFYLDDVSDISLTASGASVINPGVVASEPALRITMNGCAEFTVGATYFTLENITGTVTIDSALMETYMNYLSYNSSMDGDYPKLLPGTNLITWTGDVSQVVISPRWRTL